MGFSGLLRGRSKCHSWNFDLYTLWAGSIYHSGIFPGLPGYFFPWLSSLLSSPRYIFLVIGLFIVAVVIYSLAKHYQGLGVFDLIYIFCMVIWMSWQVIPRRPNVLLCFGSGSPGYVFACTPIANYLAGLCIPLLLMKPHLFLVFIPLMLWMGGWKTFLSGALATLGLCGIEFLITPDWVRQMLASLIQGVGNVDINIFYKFATLPTLLGFQSEYHRYGQHSNDGCSGDHCCIHCVPISFSAKNPIAFNCFGGFLILCPQIVCIRFGSFNSCHDLVEREMVAWNSFNLGCSCLDTITLTFFCMDPIFVTLMVFVLCII